MATPSPSPLPAPDVPDDTPTPPQTPAATTGAPVCAACGIEAVVHWRRRPTDDELAELAATEQARRDELLLLADPQQPAPQFGPLPTADDTTRTVYACASHAIGLDAASLIHQATCSAPNEQHLPGCDCTPEALPTTPTEEPDDGSLSRLPASWTNGGA